VAKVLAETEGIPIDDQYFLMKHRLDLCKKTLPISKNNSAIKDDQAPWDHDHSSSAPCSGNPCSGKLIDGQLPPSQKMRIPIKRFLCRIVD
jgi:hypothetical protein